MKKILVLFFILFLAGESFAQTKLSSQWSKQKANEWYAKQPWLLGSNFLPSNAINELEMWQAETWSPELIDKELGWAEAIGMNTMRVFLHDLAYRSDSAGFKKRLNQFLGLCAKHKIKPILVLFDSCWDPFPKTGKQKEPVTGVHNSGWLQAPGADILGDTTKWNTLLKPYVTDVVSSLKNDPRVLAWDAVNEPDNDNANSYGKNNYKTELVNKGEMGVKLVKSTFLWLRQINPSQPITSAPWYGDWSSVDKMNDMNRFLFENSDVITFHNYDKADEFEKRVKYLEQFKRPVICTEYMSRGSGSTFETVTPIAKKYKVGAIGWGLVSGKSQTIYAWDSWQKPYANEPVVWFHDVFRANGKPYNEAEIKLLKTLSGKK